MEIWLVRHGQTKLNKKKLMQGLTDEPLNEAGIRQAQEARAKIGDITFDAVYASPLDRAIQTGSIVGNVPRNEVITDRRIIETDFGKYELRPYSSMGLAMSLYWAVPEIFPAPKTVETVASMVKRSSSFLKELERKDYRRVLVASHGGILRALNGYLSDRRNGILWRPKMQNCEIRVYESEGGVHRFLKKYE